MNSEHTLLMSCALCVVRCAVLCVAGHCCRRCRICIYTSVCECVQCVCVFMCCAFVWVSTEFVDWLTWVGWLVVSTMTRRVQHKRKDDEKNKMHTESHYTRYRRSSLVAVRTFHFITDDVMRKMCVCLCVSMRWIMLHTTFGRCIIERRENGNGEAAVKWEMRDEMKN